MKLPRFYSLLLILTFLLIQADPGASAVYVEPVGVATALENGDEHIEEVVVVNENDGDVSFEVHFEAPQDDERLQGPRRDDLGDELDVLDVGRQNWWGLAWDGEMMWGTGDGFLGAWNFDEEEFVVQFNLNRQYIGMAFDGENFWLGMIEDQDVGTLTQIDREGQVLRSIQVQGTFVLGVAWDGENIWYYTLDFEQDRRLVSQITPDGQHLRTVDISNIIQELIIALAWVPEHEDGQLWALDGASGNIFQLNVDEDNPEVVSQGNIGNQEIYSLEHDGEDLWFAGINSPNWFKIDDGITEPRWLSVDPAEGEIPGGDETTLELFFAPEDLAAGIYEMWVLLELRENENQEPQMITFSAVLSVESPVCSLVGTVSNPAGNEPLSQVQVTMDEYLMSRTTPRNGSFQFNDLPFGIYHLTFEAPGYLTEMVEVELAEEGEFVQNVELLHAICAPGIEVIEVDLAQNAVSEVQFDVTNEGNGPLTYRVDRELLGGANADPWSLRDQVLVGEITDDVRIQGAILIEDLYYVAGANDNNPQIYVINRDGELITQFDQVGDLGSHGYKDLAYDGALIWANGTSTVKALTTDGELVTEFDSPFNPVSNIAWDPERELLWVSSTTSNIAGLDRDGNVVANYDRHGLRMYGLAYWADDPDGYNLYIFHKDSEIADQIVTKMDPESGDLRQVALLEPEEGGSPIGAYITNEFDLSSWVFLSVVNDAADDRLDIWQLDSRRDWFQIEPEAGVIEAGDTQDYTLTLSAEGLPEAPFRGVLVFQHDGRDLETRIPVTMNVTPGEPVEAERNLQLAGGWNMVSINVQPDPNDIRDLMQPLVANESLIMVKNGAGQFYVVQHDFNNIPGWNVAEGYLIKMEQADDLALRGLEVPAQQPIPLQAGWQIVSYYPRDPVYPVVALSGLGANLLLAKDGAGRFYNPEWNFCNMFDLAEGNGYQLKLAEAVDLIYVLEEEQVESLRRDERVLSPVTISSPLPTGSNMSLLVLNDGRLAGEIGIYAGDLLVGAGVLQGRRCGLAVWGDDPTTEEVEGALSGDKLSVKFYPDGNEALVNAEWIQGAANYETDGFAVVELQAPIVAPTEFGIESTSPNPFNSSTEISFKLTEDGPVSLRIFDLSGREVTNLVNSSLTAGHHVTTWNATGVSSGMYLIKLNAGGQEVIGKLMLVR